MAGNGDRPGLPRPRENNGNRIEFSFSTGGGPFGGMPFVLGGPMNGRSMGGPQALPLPFLLGSLMHNIHGGSAAPSGNMESLLERLRAAYEPPTHPTSKSAIDSLPFVPITGEHVTKQETCTVCMEEYKMGEPSVVQLPCNHLFHKECLVGWLKDHNVCPVCRFELPEERAERSSSGAGQGAPTASTGTEPAAAAGAGSRSNSMEEDDDDMVDDEDEEADIIAQALGPLFAPFFGRSPSFGRSHRRTRRRTGPAAGSEEGEEGQGGNGAAGGISGLPFRGLGGGGAAPSFFPRLVRVDRDGFAADEMEAALRASMEGGGAGGSAAAAPTSSSAAAAAAAAPSTSSAPPAPIRMDTGGGEEEAMAAVLWESLATLTVPQLQEQCVLEGLMDRVPSHMAQDKEFLQDVILRASGADMGAVGRVKRRRGAEAGQGTASSSSSSAGTPAPAAGYNRPPSPQARAVRFLDSIRIPAEPPAEDSTAYTLRLRLPDGSMLTRRWDEGDTLSQVAAWTVTGLAPGKAEAMGIKQDAQGVPQMRLRMPTLPGTSAGLGGKGSGSGTFGPGAWDVELRMAGIEQRSVLYVEPL